MNQSSSISDFCTNLKEEIIDHLKVFIDDQIIEGRNLNNEQKKLDKDFREAIDRLEKTRNKFFTSAKLAEEAKLNSELIKTNSLISAEIKQKNETQVQFYLKEAKENDKHYINALNHANMIREQYIEGSKRILNRFQEMEEEAINLTKDSLRKYLIFQVALTRCIQYDVERKSDV